jgi:hypothetical protein
MRVFLAASAPPAAKNSHSKATSAWVQPQFKAAATEETPKRFIFCQNFVHL